MTLPKPTTDLALQIAPPLARPNALNMQGQHQQLCHLFALHYILWQCV